MESTTVKSWTLILEQNGLLKQILPFSNNVNTRLIKTPIIYFEDVGLLVRLQGWTDFDPLFISPYYGHLVENIAYSEISKFFINHGLESRVSFLRVKEKTEVDFIIELPNKKYIAAEVKTTPRDFTHEQLKLLASTKLNFVEKWILSPQESPHFGSHKVIPFLKIYENLTRLMSS